LSRPLWPLAQRGVTLAGAFSILAQSHLHKHQAHSDDQPDSDHQKTHELTSPAKRCGAYRSGDDQKRGRAVNSDARPRGHG
jgi:hypothetical protein